MTKRSLFVYVHTIRNSTKVEERVRRRVKSKTKRGIEKERG